MSKILVEFDESLIDRTGKPRSRVFAGLIADQANGNEIWMSTNRTGEALEYALQFSRDNGLDFDGVEQHD